MAERREAVRRAGRPALPQRRRKRWPVAAGVAVCWAVLLVLTGSVFGATLLLALLAGLGILSAGILKAMGVTRNQPWVRRITARPWRDGQDVLRLALRHLPDVFVITPRGSLLAPNLVDLRLNPADLRPLTQRMGLGPISMSAAETNKDQVAAHGARFAGDGPASVRVMADPSVPPGRWLLRQRPPANAAPHPPPPPPPPAPPP